MGLLNSIIAAIASEFTFAISYTLIHAVVHLLVFLYAKLNIKSKYVLLSDGVLTSTSCIFLTCYVAIQITKHQNLSEIEIILIALILPLIGEIGYYRYLAFGIKSIFLGRLHLITKDPIERGRFEANYYITKQQYLLHHDVEELQKEQIVHLLRKEAYDKTQVALAQLFLWNIVGYVIGLILVHNFLF